MRENNELRKVLKPRHLWALAVGAVCSGNYYGFSYGFEAGGPASFLLAFAAVTAMYVCFMLCYMDLAVCIPSAGGATEYARRSMGGFAGFIAGISILLSFTVAACAVAITTGQLLHYLLPSVPAMGAGIGFLCFFTALNLLGASSSSRIELLATAAALGGLLLFALAALPHFRAERLGLDAPFAAGLSGIAGAVPFAMWFYFAIDGPIMQSEEMEDPRNGILKGFLPALATLFVTALIDLTLPAGIADYHEVARVDYPLTRSLELALGAASPWPKLIAGVALFAMAASFSSIVMAYSRQAYAMSRSAYLPPLFRHLNRRGVPDASLLILSALVLGLCLTGRTALMVTVSVFAALILYVLVILSDIRLHRQEPELPWPFARLHRTVPPAALVLVALLLLCVLLTNLASLKWVLLIYAAASGCYFGFGRKPSP